MSIRRPTIAAIAAAVLALSPAHAEESAPAQAVPSAPDAAASARPLLPEAGPGTLGDVVLGKADAPVTVVEYASLTCTHCAAFHKETWPTLKSRYVDTGKVRFVLRPFPLNNLDVAAAMLTRCRTDADYYPTVDVLYSNQADWAFGPKPADALQAMARKAGFADGQFESCLKEQRLLDGVVASRTNAAKASNVTATPTLIVDGEPHSGGVTVEGLDALLAPALEKSGIPKD